MELPVVAAGVLGPAPGDAPGIHEGAGIAGGGRRPRGAPHAERADVGAQAHEVFFFQAGEAERLAHDARLAERLPPVGHEPLVGLHHEGAAASASDVEGHAVRLSVVQGSPHPLARCHLRHVALSRLRFITFSEEHTFGGAGAAKSLRCARRVEVSFRSRALAAWTSPRPFFFARQDYRPGRQERGGHLPRPVMRGAVALGSQGRPAVCSVLLSAWHRQTLPLPL